MLANSADGTQAQPQDLANIPNKHHRGHATGEANLANNVQVHIQQKHVPGKLQKQ
jgi:hypothetical protein